MASYTVSSAAELAAALDDVSAGDEILLESGNYGSLTLDGYKFSDYVTIRSADSNRDAVFSNIGVYDSEHIRIDNVHVSYPKNPTFDSAFGLVTIADGSQHVEFVNSEVNGPVDNDFGGGRGVQTQNADHVLIANNVIHDVKDGGVFLSTSNLTVDGNTFEDLRRDGMKLAGVDTVQLINNIGATRYHPTDEDHTDFIQFQATSRNITIIGNVGIGTENPNFQGIFLDDGTYTNVLIENNIIYNSWSRGISVNAGSNIVAKNNTVLTTPDYGAKASAILLPPGSVKTKNVTASYLGQAQIGDNIIAQYSDPSGIAFYDDLYVNATKGVGVTIEDLKPVEGGPVDFGSGMGAEARIYELLYGSTGEPGNTKPMAVDDMVGALEDAAIEIDNLLKNDSDPDGDALDIVSVGDPDHGTAELNADGTVSYTPDQDFSGRDSFSYTIRDANGGTDTASVFIDVATVNDPPQAVDDSFKAASGSAIQINVLANDRDPDGEALAIDSFTQPDKGTLTYLGSGQFSYQAPAGLVGEVSFSYTLVDGAGETSTATVDIDVVDPGSVPSPILEEGSNTFDGTIGDAVVLANDPAFELANGALEIVFAADALVPRQALFSKDSAYFDDGGHLTILLEGSELVIRMQSDKQSYIIAVPDAAAVGAEKHLVLTFGNDGMKAYIDGVLAGSNAYTGGLLGNAEPVVIGTNQWSSGDQIANELRDPFHGEISKVSLYDQQLTDEQVLALYQSDGGGAPNGSPIAADDSAVTSADKAVAITVMDNDDDPDGDSFWIDSVSAPNNGTATIKDGTILYTPDPGFDGEDRFSYVISDGKDADTAEVIVTVEPIPNKAPIAADDFAETEAGNAVAIAVMVNDNDPDGDSFWIQSVGAPANGVVTNDAGVLTYAPAAGFAGTDTFTYDISDGDLTATATVTVTVDEATPPSLDPVFSLAGDTEFNGRSSSIVEVAPSAALEIDSGSILFSFEADTVSGRKGLISKDASYYKGGGNHFSAWIEKGSLFARFQDTDSDAIFKFDNVRANVEYDVLATFEAGQVQFFVNGDLVGSEDFTMDWTANEQYLQIGGLGWSSQSGVDGARYAFDGTISDVMIFAVPLPSLDIDNII